MLYVTVNVFFTCFLMFLTVKMNTQKMSQMFVVKENSTDFMLFMFVLEAVHTKGIRKAL